jgi:beta-lactamase regulating signal transducer with metallopeptidase domain
MPILIPYLVKLFISLSIVYLFYQLVLRRLTFYRANRWYLIWFTLISFLVPFINVTPVVEGRSEVIQYIPLVQQYSIGLEEATHCPMPLWSTSWNKWDWILLLVAIGAGILLLRLIVRCLSFLKFRNKAKLISNNGLKIYQVDESIIPFSFGNSIFINSSQHTEAELSEIIRHEFIHVKQRHTVDILWAELLCMLNWYNPAAWLLRNSIRQNLEFIADHQVLENGVDRKQYQYLLLKVIGNDQFSIAQKFNFSSLKKRIAMMNKTKSARVNLLRFLFVLPVLAVILLSFRHQRTMQSQQESQVFTDTLPEPTRPNEKGYFIRIKDNKGECMVVVSDKQGRVLEKLPLTKWNDQLEAKYGEIPPPPPPKAPAPPGEPANPPVPPVPAKPAQPGTPAIPPTPPAPPTPVKDSDKLITLANNFEITDKKAVIYRKDGVKEHYDLTLAGDRRKFESRWGKIIETNHGGPVTVVGQLEGEIVIAPTEAITRANEVTVIDSKGTAINGKEEILVTISKYTSREQLEDFKKQMRLKDIDLIFDIIDYNEKGMLVSIGGTLSGKQGTNTFIATDFEKMILSIVYGSDRTYYKLNLITKKEVS